MSIKVYVSDVIALLNNPELFDKIYSCLPACRKKKADRFRFYKDKCLSVGAGYLLKLAAEDLGFPGIDKEIAYTTHEKPYFAAEQSFHFNLSHSGTKVMCAVSSSPIGCDVEFMDEKHIDVARKSFSEPEKIILNNSKNKIDTFFRLWTLKESFMKLSGLGFALPPNSFSISLDENITVSQDKFDGKFNFFEFDICEDYKFSCAVKDCDDAFAEVINVDLLSLPAYQPD